MQMRHFVNRIVSGIEQAYEQGILTTDVNPFASGYVNQKINEEYKKLFGRWADRELEEIKIPKRLHGQLEFIDPYEVVFQQVIKEAQERGIV